MLWSGFARHASIFEAGKRINLTMHRSSVLSVSGRLPSAFYASLRSTPARVMVQRSPGTWSMNAYARLRPTTRYRTLRMWSWSRQLVLVWSCWRLKSGFTAPPVARNLIHRTSYSGWLEFGEPESSSLTWQGVASAALPFCRWDSGRVWKTDAKRSAVGPTRFKSHYVNARSWNCNILSVIHPTRTLAYFSTIWYDHPGRN